MDYSVIAFKVVIKEVNPESWIIRALNNNGYNLNNCLELDYNSGVIGLEVYLEDWDWVCELLYYTLDPDNTRAQLLEFYNKVRTEYPTFQNYPVYK